MLKIFSKRKKEKKFEEEIKKYMDKLYSFSLYLTANEDDASDLVQETVLKAFKNYDKFTPGTNFKAWLYTILINTHKNNLKRKSLIFIDNDNLKPMIDRKTPEVIYLRHDVTENIKKGVEKLPVEYKTVFLLADFEGYSYKEIADILDCPIGTVMSRLFRARKYLKSILLKKYSTIPLFNEEEQNELS